MRFDSLQEWLNWQEGLNPKEISLGLERTRLVWSKLPRFQDSTTIITVAGTNGKGSSVAMLDAILQAAGYRTGCYTSPHLVHYNERIRINGQPLSDLQICRAFEHIDQVRGETPLTYFEYGTLAALYAFPHESPYATPSDVVYAELENVTRSHEEGKRRGRAKRIGKVLSEPDCGWGAFVNARRDVERRGPSNRARVVAVETGEIGRHLAATIRVAKEETRCPLRDVECLGDSGPLAGQSISNEEGLPEPRGELREGVVCHHERIRRRVHGNGVVQKYANQMP